MDRPAGRIAVALTILLASALLAVAPQADGQTPAVLSVSVRAEPSGRPLPTGFVGLSIEYRALRAYTGSDPAAINPVLIQLITGLNPGQRPVLRIGGRSTDSSWWPIADQVTPGGIDYTLTPAWMNTTRALAALLDARLIVGVNLAAGQPAIAAAEARALLAGLGRHYIQAFEIGNEADLYRGLSWYRDRSSGVQHYARSRSYTLSDFRHDFGNWRAALGGLPIAGPAFGNLTWLAGLGSLLRSEPGLRMVTVHRYPLINCWVRPGAWNYPTIAKLLSDATSRQLAHGIVRAVKLAHTHGAKFRVDELNSVACSGRRKISDTFASALWMLDTLFAMDSVHVDGVNVHTLPRAAYEPFTFAHSRGGWRAFVRPEYYGMLLFSRAAPPGSRLLHVDGARGDVKVWATIAWDGVRRVVLINRGRYRRRVYLRLPGAAGAARIERLLAPNVRAMRGVTIGGLSFGRSTTSGLLAGIPDIAVTWPVAGRYVITLPPTSAALVTQS